jgi:hypothetical protein
MTADAGRNERGQFLPGLKPQHGGRPKGARDRHSRNFLNCFADDFEKHGAAVIAKVREEKPDVYLRIAADLLPREATLDIDVSVLHDVSNTLEAFRVLRDALAALISATLSCKPSCSGRPCKRGAGRRWQLGRLGCWEYTCHPTFSQCPCAGRGGRPAPP